VLLENLYLFFTSAMVALAMENAIFARSLGLSRSVLFMKTPGAGILCGGILTWIATASSVLVAGVNYLVEGAPYASFIRMPGYLLCVCLVYAATYLYTKKKRPALFRVIRPYLPISTFNTALFGAFYISSLKSFGFFQTVGYALGTGVGYTIAIYVIYYARKRLAISPVPRSFRGLPVLLVYIGFLSLAIYGLIGHGLPS